MAGSASQRNSAIASTGEIINSDEKSRSSVRPSVNGDAGPIIVWTNAGRIIAAIPIMMPATRYASRR